ncbi:E3 ubiquitin-protein ligase PDZRN3-like [Tubulanus polymorphus]|uniref:E3 ubiquitin-protein ligase PDZRN3-like n=1 Tax=Tubulanus polymorphus TaxID=672921 RepID=UPI003DA63964
MGYSVHRFISHVDQNLICPICSAALEEAVLTPCGHSFCLLCLETWLTRSDNGVESGGTCPECRAFIRSSESKPVIAIRNLINGMNIICENQEHGCSLVVKLDRLTTHLETCGYTPVKCNGCGVKVLRFELAGHQIGCSALQDTVTDDHSKNRFGIGCCSSFDHAELTCRVASLELQMKRLKKDLELAESKNQHLERELKNTKDELQDKRNQLFEQQFSDFDPDYQYGFQPNSIKKLSVFIAKFLERRPSYVDRTRIFHAVKRCYENYNRGNDQHENDVNMLIATSNASNWFTENQKMHFQHWLNCMTRLRQINQGLSSPSVLDNISLFSSSKS